MKKRRYLPALLICTALLLTACSGFNRRMRDHLSSMESYSRYPCTFTALSQEHDICAFIVSLDEMPDDDLQYGCCYDEEYSAEICRLEMIAANYERLERNGFSEEIAAGDALVITASPFIYMDTNFFYIIGVESADKVYLDEETGLANMVEMMEENGSLL